MEHFGEVTIPDFLRLMKDFLEHRIDAELYCSSYFDLAIKRKTITDKEDRILQMAFGDADDYDAEIRL